MGYLDLEASLAWLKSPDLTKMFIIVQNAVNNLNQHNFPNKVSGDMILSLESITGSSLLKDRSVPFTKLLSREWPVALVLPTSAASTTSSLDCGGYLRYNPATMAGAWYFEAALRISSASYIATATLKQNGATVGSVTTQSTTVVVVRSGVLTMPSAAATLTVTLSSNNASGTAYLHAARMICLT